MKTLAHAEPSDADWARAIVSHLADGVAVIDQDGVIRYMNPAARRLTGHDPQTAPGRAAADLFVFLDRKRRSPLSLPTPESFATDDRAKDASVVFSEAVLVPPKKKEMIVNAVFTPLTDGEAPAVGMIVRFRDVTATVQAARRERDQQKIEAISAMAGSIAREFTNWLGMISSHAAAIVDNLIPRTRAYEEAVRILNATKRANGLTKRLLSIARTRRERTAVKLKPVYVDAAIRSAAKEMQSQFNAAGVRFKLKSTPGLPQVLAQNAQLLDCFVNLFQNAVDAMPEGGAITVDFPAARLQPSKREYLIIRIRDTGQGISKPVLDHVFDPFYSTKDPASAIGLGLTIVQTNIEQWGGMVRIRSRPDQGTSVRIFLRRAHDGQHAEAQRDAAVSPAEILIVDDQESLRNDLAVILESAGFQPHQAGSADEALSFYRHHANSIDLLIIDLLMPGKDGKQLLNNVLGINPQANVIMTSGFPRDYVRNYLQRGAWGFVQKPVDPDYLLALIQRMLKQE